MTHTQFRMFRKVLQTLEAALAKDLARSQGYRVAGARSRAWRGNGGAAPMQPGGHKATQLAKVRAALERLDKGTFGTCLSCGKPISPSHLTSVPWTSHCLECSRALSQFGAGEVIPINRGARDRRV
jgi:RNA polymerase-binding transcription factor DksA